MFSITLEVPELSECRCPALSGNSIYWARSGRRCCRIGLGMALELRASGGRRFTQLEHEFEGLRRSWIHRDPEGTGFSPQAFIGFSFAAEESESPTWSGFSNATLIVPELLLEQNGASCTITFSGVMDAAASTDELHRCWIIRTKELLTGFLPATDDPIGHSTQALTQIEVEPADAEWLDMAETALEDIRSGLLEKVVLTRRIRVAGEHSLQPARLMKWIESHYPDCVQFAMNRGDSTLVGASPESLVVLTGRSLLSDVLAGTAIRVAQDDGGHGSGEALLRNPKIRHEHRLVLDDIVRSLEPLCESLNVPSVPQVMTLPTLQHLWSPIH
ncbi:MAG: hypothetical protein GY731_17635, partial [Gammaproteobacteria bacterium]|nr:hypothetical protein [Gammaproteobacteria bacterium]